MECMNDLDSTYFLSTAFACIRCRQVAWLMGLDGRMSGWTMRGEMAVTTGTGAIGT